MFISDRCRINRGSPRQSSDRVDNIIDIIPGGCYCSIELRRSRLILLHTITQSSIYIGATM